MSGSTGPRRIGQVVYLRPEYYEEYKKCHAAVWPDVLAQIKDSNIIDCTSLL
jgi:L-rhamnose mutarotase